MLFYTFQQIDNCENDGECFGPSLCFCSSIFTGAYCEMCLCEDLGTADGGCETGADQCLCKPGYSGII